MTDEFSMEFPRTSLQDAVKGDRKQQLDAIRDYIAHELEANLCHTCRNSRLRTGDQASLILRLQTVLAELENIVDDQEESPLDNIRRLRAVGDSDSEDSPISGKGAKRRSGGRGSRSSGRPHP